MFSSIFNNASPIFNVDNSMSFLVDDINLNSKQEDPLYLSTYYHDFPCQLIYNEVENFGDFLNQHQDHLDGSIEQVLRATSSALTDDSSIFEVANKMGSNNNDEEVKIKNIKSRPSSNSYGVRRRRSCKKDRHSKINTAQGLRDRRMRLSLEVARPFFKLQDMLGYDRASKTIEWLLTQSKSAIEEEVTKSKKQTSPSGLTKCTISSSSDCEVESITIYQEKKDDSIGKISSSPTSKSIAIAKQKSKGKPKRKTKKTTKESRAEARARARKRTFDRLMQSRAVKDDHNHGNFSRFASCFTTKNFEMIKAYNDSNLQLHQNGINNPAVTEIRVHVNRSNRNHLISNKQDS